MTDETVDATVESFQDMSLDELREEMEDINRGIVELATRRTHVADTVARVEAGKGLPTIDESQEERTIEHTGKNVAHFEVDLSLMRAIFRLLIEMSEAGQRQNR